jgi:uncharacterized protein (TIGR00645 family)
VEHRSCHPRKSILSPAAYLQEGPVSGRFDAAITSGFSLAGPPILEVGFRFFCPNRARNYPIKNMLTSDITKSKHTISGLIFLSRWLQAPLYFGLIVAQIVYVYHFMVELWHLVQQITTIKETEIMLVVLGLIDVVMIANLLIMVIVGGYETFVSRLNLKGHPDEPEWLSHVNAGVLKVKLATALIGISSIHLLKTFIDTAHQDQKTIMWQVIIHLTFVVSALLLAWVDRLTGVGSKQSNGNSH